MHLSTRLHFTYHDVWGLYKFLWFYQDHFKNSTVHPIYHKNYKTHYIALLFKFPDWPTDADPSQHLSGFYFHTILSLLLKHKCLFLIFKEKKYKLLKLLYGLGWKPTTFKFWPGFLMTLDRMLFIIQIKYRCIKYDRYLLSFIIIKNVIHHTPQQTGK